MGTKVDGSKAVRRARKDAEGLFAGYSKEKLPLGGYATLAGLFTAGLAAGLTLTANHESESDDLGWSELILLGIATHKLTRIATKDFVTSPFRAPFVKYKKSAGAGEVEEEARGEGLQEAVGDLISCPYCMAPWVASILVFSFRLAPRATRVIASIFSITAASDFLNQLYARVKD
ncbi:MAG: DUF1360 domain-containing protein [Chthoniobacterales bacterium]